MTICTKNVYINLSIGVREVKEVSKSGKKISVDVTERVRHHRLTIGGVTDGETRCKELCGKTTKKKRYAFPYAFSLNFRTRATVIHLAALPRNACTRSRPQKLTLCIIAMKSCFEGGVHNAIAARLVVGKFIQELGHI